MGSLFRGKMLSALEHASAHGRIDLGAVDLQALRRKSWVVYAKRPFGGPQQVIRYLGRYTHRVGISNQRLVSMDERGVTFRTKSGTSVTVSPIDMLARFVEHVLPPRFVKIRHYGLHAASHATTRLGARPAKTRSRGPDATAPRRCAGPAAAAAASDGNRRAPLPSVQCARPRAHRTPPSPRRVAERRRGPRDAALRSEDALAMARRSRQGCGPSIADDSRAKRLGDPLRLLATVASGAGDDGRRGHRHGLSPLRTLLERQLPDTRG